MPSFVVKQRRPMWVEVSMTIDAKNEKDAEDRFYNEYDPEKVEVQEQIMNLGEGPLDITPCEPPMTDEAALARCKELRVSIMEDSDQPGLWVWIDESSPNLDACDVSFATAADAARDFLERYDEEGE